MEETARRIEIFAPFAAALELTKRILFQPFDLAKWCLIAFAAFLARLGQGSGFNFPTNWGNEDWQKVRSAGSEATGGLSALPGLIVSAPWPVILFFFFSAILALAVIMIACLLTCATCCLAAIPYVGTVILLPIFVFRQAYLLLFVRQFGPEYDVWTGLAPAVPVAPPVQDPPAPTQPPAVP